MTREEAWDTLAIAWQALAGYRSIPLEWAIMHGNGIDPIDQAWRVSNQYGVMAGLLDVVYGLTMDPGGTTELNFLRAGCDSHPHHPDSDPHGRKTMSERIGCMDCSSVLRKSIPSLNFAIIAEAYQNSKNKP